MDFDFLCHGQVLHKQKTQFISTVTRLKEKEWKKKKKIGSEIHL